MVYSIQWDGYHVEQSCCRKLAVMNFGRPATSDGSRGEDEGDEPPPVCSSFLPVKNATSHWLADLLAGYMDVCMITI